MSEVIKNYIDGCWVASESEAILDVRNPATGEVIAQVSLSTPEEVDAAVRAARDAFRGWRETPPYIRARYMSGLKGAVEARREDIARIITQEHGKVIEEARGEVRRTIENVEVAAGIPSLMTGYNLEDVSAGIDEDCVRQPIGVFCAIAPFNFPAMVPFWFMPYAVACGNTYIVKPSEQTPLSQNLLFEIIDEVGFPDGVINLVNGAQGVVDGLLEHPDVAGVSFVGSTPVARTIYSKAAKYGKRVQAQAGAKNFLVVMPDAVLEHTVPALMSSFFGNTGQRCLAGSVLLLVGDAYEKVKEQVVEAASQLRVGYGMDEGVQVGPVISRRALDRITGYIERGLEEGAELLLDGRGVKVEGYPGGLEQPAGYFIGPTIFAEVTPEMAIAREEIFGPVMSIIHVGDFEEALAVIEANPYGNAASIFTASGGWAREFKYRVQCGNIGINIGVAAPIASFPFGGMKQSFFGDLHGQGQDAINFFTDRKVVISRWF
jgi:malonate-semialdehyde dehydrogenase (acetylating)/methylmalonate-semialdehyde dehydrogenase